MSAQEPFPAGAQARQAIRDRLAARAAHAARFDRHSLNCRGWGRIPGQHVPCANDGTVCLCACHDQATSEVPA